MSDKRLKSFAAKASHSESQHFAEVQRDFVVSIRRNRMLAQWVSEVLGLEKGNDYFSQLNDADLRAAGSDVVVDKVLADLRDRGLELSRADVKAKLEAFEHAARGEYDREYPAVP
ncbi:ATPase inhibitor subunit zeta [Thalassospira xianhensis]|uniref:ATPase inhibitor subunit zeta n=1 Tax=Thalassospira xianhensis TaxID=478503 RepID=UPI000DED5974|nr:ATPase inhibitor subunit zeta [Thalassospira xianhensis]